MCWKYVAGSLELLKTDLREIAAVILELIVKFDMTKGRNIEK